MLYLRFLRLHLCLFLQLHYFLCTSKTVSYLCLLRLFYLCLLCLSIDIVVQVYGIAICIIPTLITELCATISQLTSYLLSRVIRSLNCTGVFLPYLLVSVYLLSSYLVFYRFYLCFIRFSLLLVCFRAPSTYTLGITYKYGLK